MRRWFVRLSCCAALLGVAAVSSAADKVWHRFEQVLLSEEFRSEGAAFADLDGDGDNDIVSGNVWFEGPEYRVQHEYMSGSRHPIVGYSQHFFSWTHDFNGDKKPDILVVGFPGAAAKWFENPGSKDGKWVEHLAVKEASGESPDFADINGDGRPELVCILGGQFGFAQFDPAKPNDEWTFTAITPKGPYGAFTHGQGLGDVNKDGRVDFLDASGWWEQPAKPGELFLQRPQKFCESGGADILVSDFDGDGDNDVLSSQNPHGFGLSWFENRGNAGAWVPHRIMTAKPEDNPYGLAISQMHALALADIDGDGVQDIVTGKRFYAHAAGDPGVSELPVLYWFQTVRGPQGVEFIPHFIDDTSGVGTQVTVGDVTGDGLADILIGNKRGTFLFAHKKETVSEEKYAALLPQKQNTPRHLPGLPDFANGVRSTEALDPEAERKTFVMPHGFEATLIAAEPEIQKPMNLAFDTRGRLWASMSLEYPYAAPLDRDGKDIIKIFEDTDGDGRFDKQTTFADKLNIPIGLYPYQDGVVVCSIPNIWFLRDTDNDGVCDKREILYGPIGYDRDTHGMCNAFRRGFDGWLYSCHGFNNNTSLKGKDGNVVTMSSGNTFRMRLDGSRVEHFTHGQVNPFGQTFDPFGNQLTADCHTKPITLLLPGGYYESFGKPHDGLGYVPNVMDHLHGSTAIAGIAQCNSDSFPAVYRGNTFGGNVMTSRINRNSLIERGSTIRAQEEPDFLIAGDSWFRPVDIIFGPDGAMYVADFYNKIIGHYEVPLPHPGRDRFRGRIWKISYKHDANRRDAVAARDEARVASANSPLAPVLRGEGPGVRGNPAADPAPQSAATSKSPSPLTPLPGVPGRGGQDLALGSLSIDQLVEQLELDNLNRRMLIADRLVDHFGEKSIPAATKGLQSKSHTVRAHCLWVLDRLNALPEEALLKAFSDESPLVRTHAARIAGAKLFNREPLGSASAAASSLKKDLEGSATDALDAEADVIVGLVPSLSPKGARFDSPGRQPWVSQGDTTRAPKGRDSVPALSVEPVSFVEPASIKRPSPNAASSARQAATESRPVGAIGSARAASPGLAPWAIESRPFGANAANGTLRPIGDGLRDDGTSLRPEGASDTSLGQATNGSAALGQTTDSDRALKGHRNASQHSGAPSGHDDLPPFTQGGAPVGRLPWADLRSPFGAKTITLDGADDGALAFADFAQGAAPERAPTNFVGARVAVKRAELVAALIKLLDDANPQVKRAAAISLGQTEDPNAVRPLMSALAKAEKDDVHLQHALKMSLRNQLKNEAAFAKLTTEPLNEAEAQVVAGLALGIKTPAAGTFLIKHLSKVPTTDRARLVEIVKAAASQASANNVGEIVNVARSRFEDDRGLQIELLNSVKQGLAQSGTQIPSSVREWALALAKPLLRIGEENKVISWSYSPFEGQPDQGNCFVIQERVSSDNQKALYFGSLPLGEQRTGYYRSGAFAVGKKFSFFCAGHYGQPGEPIKKTTFIRLRDAKSNELLFEALPPRNDTAQKTEWDTTPHAGKQVFIEIVDGDTRNAYAWLAVGRFSVEGLNPDQSSSDRKVGAQLVGAFALNELVPGLRDVLKQLGSDRDTSAAIAEALVANQPQPKLSAIVDGFRIAGSTPKLREACVAALLEPTTKNFEAAITDSVKVATTPEQLRIAEKLAGDMAGATDLLALAENGRLQPALLTRPSVQTKLAVVKNDEFQKRLAALVSALPAEDAKVEELIKSKKTDIAAMPGKAELGAAIFKKNCAICHQVAGQGAQVGPNLDGIGNRGIDRLLEDVLAPNRNVDVAFRTTTIVTKSGKVMSGLIKPSEGQELTLIDNQGKPQMIPLADIEERVPSRLSLMPANVVEQVPAEDFRNLIAYLLTLRSQ